MRILKQHATVKECLDFRELDERHTLATANHVSDRSLCPYALDARKIRASTWVSFWLRRAFKKTMHIFCLLDILVDKNSLPRDFLSALRPLFLSRGQFVRKAYERWPVGQEQEIFRFQSVAIPGQAGRWAGDVSSVNTEAIHRALYFLSGVPVKRVPVYSATWGDVFTSNGHRDFRQEIRWIFTENLTGTDFNNS